MKDWSNQSRLSRSDNSIVTICFETKLNDRASWSHCWTACSNDVHIGLIEVKHLNFWTINLPVLHGISCCRKSYIRMTSSCRNEWISDTRYCPNAPEMIKNECFLGIHHTKDLNTLYLLSTVSNIIGCTSCNMVRVFWQSSFFSSMFLFNQITKFLTMVVSIDEYLTVLLFLKQWPFFKLIYFSLNFWWI